MKTLQRSYFRDAVLVQLVFLCSEVCGEGIRAANHLNMIMVVCGPQQLCLCQVSGVHLEHVLVEVLLLLLIVPEPLENELTEVRKIYEPLPANNNSNSRDCAGWWLVPTWRCCWGCPPPPAPRG